MIYILNPGDGHDVTTHGSHLAARAALEAALEAGHAFAALYSSDGTILRKYERGNWFEVERGGIQIKVLDAARKAAGPKPFARTADASSDSRGDSNG